MAGEGHLACQTAYLRLGDKPFFELNYSQPNLGGIAPEIRGRLTLPTPYATDAMVSLHERMGWPPPIELPRSQEGRGRWPARMVGLPLANLQQLLRYWG